MEEEAEDQQGDEGEDDPPSVTVGDRRLVDRSPR